MLRRKVILLGLAMVLFLPLSCTKMDQVAVTGTEMLDEEKLPADGTIPSGYGNLVSVSSAADSPDFVQLWFQDENGTIRMVRYSIRANRFLTVSYVIPRK